MAILLYKKGDAHTVRGIKCDFIRCDVSEKEYYLGQGYVGTVQELEEKEPAKPVKTAAELEAEEKERLEAEEKERLLATEPEVIRGMERDELVVLAKAKGIKTGTKGKDKLIAEILGE